MHMRAKSLRWIFSRPQIALPESDLRRVLSGTDQRFWGRCESTSLCYLRRDASLMFVFARVATTDTLVLIHLTHKRFYA